jgi:hypothetical protein
MPRISVVLNVRNEAAHLAACLASCEGVEDIVVADMESTDDTVAIATAVGARLLRLPNAGYCEPGRQPAIDAATEEWVLVIDADERLSDGGVEQLRALAAAAMPDISAFLLPFPTYLGSRLIRRTGWGLECERHPRFFRKSHVRWPSEIHVGPRFAAAVVDLPPGVNVALKHFKFDSLEHAISKFNRYTSVEADERRAASRTSTPAEAIRDGIAEFTRRYSPDEDGALSLALSMGFLMYRFLTHMKTIERSTWPSTGVPGNLPMRRAWDAFLETLTAAEHEQARATARSEYARGRFDVAAGHLREATANWGQDATTLSDLAAAETARGSLAAASEAVDAALALQPQHPDARVTRFCLDLLMGRREAPTRVAIDWSAAAAPPQVLSLGSSVDGAGLPAHLADLPLTRATLVLVLVGSGSLGSRSSTDAAELLSDVARLLAPGGRLVIGSPPPGPAQAAHLTAHLRLLGLEVADDERGLVGFATSVRMPGG